jgi:DNA modification methylase
VGVVAQALKRRFTLCEIKAEYAEMAALRIRAGGNGKLMDEFEGAVGVGQTTLDWGDAGG